MENKIQKINKKIILKFDLPEVALIWGMSVQTLLRDEADEDTKKVLKQITLKTEKFLDKKSRDTLTKLFKEEEYAY